MPNIKNQKTGEKGGNVNRVGRALGLALALLLTISCGFIPGGAQPTPTATATLAPSATPTHTFAPTLTPVPPTITVSATPFTPTPSAPAAPVNLEGIGTVCTVDKSVEPAKFVNQFHLYWQDLSTNEEGFRVYRDGDLVAELPSNRTEVVDEIISPNNKPHFYYIIAYNAVGEAKSEIITLSCSAGGGGGYNPQ